MSGEDEETTRRLPSTAGEQREAPHAETLEELATAWHSLNTLVNTVVEEVKAGRLDQRVASSFLEDSGVPAVILQEDGLPHQ